MNCEREQQRDEAWRILRANYWQDVRGVITWTRDAVRSGEIVDEDGLHDWLHETVDGHARVILTHLAMETLLVSDNADAVADTFSEVPMFDRDAVNWGAMAYYAFQRDVEEHPEFAEVLESVGR